MLDRIGQRLLENHVNLSRRAKFDDFEMKVVFNQSSQQIGLG